ncbi:hypothetical protein MFIFM68171_10728 [Madurella fahalii]|uniref:C2H2-type domain-containing protein n=1 Tax=Madurella fahalii TaxID=1157608 RepID=A0ABQ0GS06_9PEZI
MEKAHKWVYVRSKSKGIRAAGQHSPTEPETPTEEHHNPPVAVASLHPPAGPSPGMDFILFDSDQVDAIGEDDDTLYLESYLPWASPNTRTRKNEMIIEMVTQAQTYSDLADKTTAVGATDVLVDPMLCGQVPCDSQNHQGVDAPGLFVNDPAIKVESPVVTADEILAADLFVPRKRKHGLVEVPPGDSNSNIMPPSGGQLFGNRKSRPGQASQQQSEPNPNRRGGSDEGNRPPMKKPRLSPPAKFTDTSMPDIFRSAHPNIYDRDQKEKYSPCHTLHRDISTLVRHLSRPAHRFMVNERIISSFDIQDQDYRHPRAGLCRWCWRAFFDRSTFDAHVSRPCEKVSKGKQEKWRALYETFTPLVDLGHPESHSSECKEKYQWPEGTTSLGGFPVSDCDGDFPDVCGTPPTSVPSPALPSAGFAASNPNDTLFVRADEHRKLQKEHQDLRESHQHLQQMAQVLLAPYLQQAMCRTAQSVLKPLTVGTPMDSHPASVSEASDQDNLVGHMDSQSTNVDVHAFMDEMENFSTRQSLFRMNSGFSITSHTSTIHHVPNSPPPWHAEPLDPEQGSGDHTEGQEGKKPLAHRPPPASIPDSGYGTENRRPSVGDVVYPTRGDKLLTPLPALDKGNNAIRDIDNDDTHGDPAATPIPHQNQHSQATNSLFDDATYNMYDSEPDHLLRTHEFGFDFSL